MRKERRGIKEIDEDIWECTEKQETLKKERLAVLRSTRLSCPCCEKRSTLSQWIFIQTYHYERPHGCTEGGDWKKNDPQECWVRCPRCSKELYLFFLKRKKILDTIEKAGHLNLSELFATIEEVDEDNLRKPMK